MEFLRYPPLIPAFFNIRGFGPPYPFTGTSTWAWIGHPVSGLQYITSRAFHTRFPFGFAPSQRLTLLCLATRRTVLQKVPGRRALPPLPASVNKGFQVLFHSPPGVLFTFPSQYCFTIGRQVVFRLGGWSPRFPAGFLVSRGTLDTAACLPISPTGFSPSMIGFPNSIRLSSGNSARSPQPR